ncbi:hypothetical protein [Solidesulfovibrio magneticus]|uniref:Uncharacterized protein n=1 Tax=Solidesulfovibrio magneticus (strain ATCC 700980 / DSM 13731 / RS-1) TaxID=573370 RepID=C4XN14_SOLM1|nr:hypothetical protein [Solidesulfovibrio magneticus]BAH77317.1 hypothetical protein DMR_38260 [Solidesulfovibrio magneticus RS-1]
METILLKILEVQNEILAEVRMLRQAVTHGAPLAAQAAAPASQPLTAAAPPSAPEPAPQAAYTPTFVPEPEPEPQPYLAPPQQQPGGRLTVNELADLGGQFLDPGQMPRGKVKAVDASDLSHSILDDIKAKNKAKRSAFAEFEKFDRFK